MRVINKRAKFDYELTEPTEAGIILSGAEAKSARAGQVSLEGAYVKMIQDEAWIINMQIFPYKYAQETNYEPGRTRKLLLGKKEILAMEQKMKQSRLTLIPTAVYSRGPKVKVEIAMGRGKRIYEKREAIKKAEWEREQRG